MCAFVRPAESIEDVLVGDNGWAGGSAFGCTMTLRNKTWPYLQLMRPANLVTAAADILAGYAAAGLPGVRSLVLLVVASIGLYGGGVVLNDVFDAKLDAAERPERPIPSGRASIRNASLLGVLLLTGGITTASFVSWFSGAIAAAVAALAVTYDAWSKHHSLIGPMNMAACRGLNVLLGVSSAPFLISHRWYLGLLSCVYVAAITLLSAGEVHGGRRKISLLALQLVGLVIAGLLVLGNSPAYAVLAALPFIALFSWRVLPPFTRAYFEPQPATIRRAVLVGVLSLIVLDSAVGAGYAGILYGAGILSLSLVAGGMARLFAVT